jgi:glycosyltransferase involved in cell wall biosynthesis
MLDMDVSLIVTTWQMPWHLQRVLASIARQSVAERLQVIVSDDGSTDETEQVVREFCRTSGLRVQFLTHPHNGFHLTRCRNDAARVATADYLLFLDGDCIIPPDHVEQYLAARRPGVVHYGYCCRLERELSEQIDVAAVASADFRHWATWSERRKLAAIHYKGLLYQWIGHPTKPALKGGNIGISREDFERLNGFDENFRAWGCEDDDLSNRVRAAGLKIASILNRTNTYHLWHPPATTKPNAKWSDGQNVQYLQRRGRLTCCMNGLKKRTIGDLRFRLAGLPDDGRQAAQFIRQVFGDPKPGPAEIELLFLPGDGSFSKSVDCRVLVAENPLMVPERLKSVADIVVPLHAHRAAKLLAHQLYASDPRTELTRQAA